MFRLVKEEALAYLKLGILAPQKHKIRANTTQRAPLGVIFVPGMGANGSQFLALRDYLSAHAEWFDAYEYSSLSHLPQLAQGLVHRLARSAAHCERVVVVGHSLGGLLTRMALQAEEAPSHVAGFVSICAPLHGTWRSKLAPYPSLRQLSPESPLMTQLFSQGHRLDRLRGRILTIGARRDQFIQPHTSAFLEGHEQLLLEDVAHAASLFDRRAHQHIADFVGRLPR